MPGVCVIHVDLKPILLQMSAEAKNFEGEGQLSRFFLEWMPEDSEKHWFRAL